jgi:cytochrome c peroxidase
MKWMRLAAVAAVPAFIACGGGEGDNIGPDALAPFASVPARMDVESNPAIPARVELGRHLYYDTRLSLDESMSCNTCHNLATYGVDGNPTSQGVSGELGGRNSPTVYHAAGHVAQFWDGRAADVEEQAKGPILNPVEMAMPSEREVMTRLRGIPEYVRAFEAAFPGDPNAMTYDNLGKAIGAFERGLVTPSRWDAYLAGNVDSLTPEERDGLAASLDAGCQACHAGAYVGGNMFQKLGTVEPWPSEADPGRYAVTGEDADRMMFKVPSLRNVAETGPYFHDGSVSTLWEAVRLMDTHQLGRVLTDDQIRRILMYLEALTGEIPADYIAQPEPFGL